MKYDIVAQVTTISEKQLGEHLRYITDVRTLDRLHDRIYQVYSECMDKVKGYGPQDEPKPGEVKAPTLSPKQYLIIESTLKKYERMIRQVSDRKTEIVFEQYARELFG